jgi:hypothetical protein
MADPGKPKQKKRRSPPRPGAAKPGAARPGAAKPGAARPGDAARPGAPTRPPAAAAGAHAAETPAQAGATKAGKAELAQFLAALHALQGQPCLYYLTSPSGGSALDLHFGAKVPRRQPLELPGLTAVQRHHEGERSLYLTCAWRLETRDAVLCGCWDDSGTGGQMRHGLDQLIGQRVRRAIAQPPAWDLVLEFENGLLLRVFCDQTSDEEGGENYAVFTADTVFLVGTLSDVFIESRAADDD